MKFTEEKLEQAIIELFSEVEIPHCHGETVHKEMSDVLLRDDLRSFLRSRYSAEEITENEIESVIRKLELFPSSDLYGSNKAHQTYFRWRYSSEKIAQERYLLNFDYNTIENNVQARINSRLKVKNASLMEFCT
jgi:type I restriction enzyme R subunit